MKATFSISFLRTGSMLIGRLILPVNSLFLSLGRGMTLASFQTPGQTQCLRDILNMWQIGADTWHAAILSSLPSSMSVPAVYYMAVMTTTSQFQKYSLVQNRIDSFYPSLYDFKFKCRRRSHQKASCFLSDFQPCL